MDPTNEDTLNNAFVLFDKLSDLHLSSIANECLQSGLGWGQACVSFIIANDL